MTIQALFILSNQELLRVITQVSKDQLELMMPLGASSKPGNLKTAIAYHSYDDAWVPDVLAGKTKEEVGNEYDSLLNADDVLTNYAKYNTVATNYVRGFNDLTKQTHLSYGDYPAKDYLQHIITFRAFRSYDIAKLIGIDSTMNPVFVEALISEYTPLIDGYRTMGVFPPPLVVSDDASPQEKLLAMVGRS